LLKSKWGGLHEGNPQQENLILPCSLETNYKGEYTMIYKLKQKLRVNWKFVWEMTFSTLLMAFLIALVTADFFNLAG